MWTLLKLYFGKTAKFLEPVLKAFLTSAAAILAEAATAAVAEVAKHELGLTDNEKRDAAFNLIKKDMERKGIQAGASAINLAIECAVAGMKQK